VAVDWVERERRFDLLREVDVLVALHRPGIETDLSFRTRFLDALVAGCPVVATEGGALSHQLRSAGAGWLVPPGDVAATVEALRQAVEAGPLRSARVAAGLALAERFAVTWPTRAPRDSFSFRVRRKLRRLVGGGA
jgi:glycosyltransferase involved in cell wall biosynthesis